MRAGLLLAFLSLALAACASSIPVYSPRPASQDSTRPETGSTEPSVAGAETRAPSDVPGPRENTASAALLEQSRDERAAGNLPAAAASVERALAIDPNNAALWIELAEIRAAEGDRDQADSMARKALTLAGNDRSIVSRAERLTSR